MSAIENTIQYHATIEPPYRIQKRLVLNQCFRLIHTAFPSVDEKVSYITFGGAQLYDVIDLFSVFDIRKSKYSVYSFEMNKEVALAAENSIVAKTLGMTDRVKITVVQGNIADRLGELKEAVRDNSRVFFLDFCDCFRPNPHQSLIESLLRFKLLKENDFLIVTSCLTPRVTHQSRFMNTYEGAFADYYMVPRNQVDAAFKARNHVDLLIGQSFVKHNGYSQNGSILIPNLLNKYRYRDTRVPMGVWVYSVSTRNDPITSLSDKYFEEYPWPSEDASKVVADEVEFGF